MKDIEELTKLHETVQKLLEATTVTVKQKVLKGYKCRFVDNSEADLLDKDLRETSQGRKLLMAFRREEISKLL